MFSMFPKDMVDNFKIKDETEPMNITNILDSKDSLINNINLIKSIIKLKTNQFIAESNVFKDLEVFEGVDNKEHSIFNVINKTNTLFGELYLKNILETPTKDLAILKERQNILNKITSDMASKIKEKLGVLKELEEDVLWILRERNPEEINLIDSVYFTNKYLTMFNSNEDIMSLYSLFIIFFAPIYGIVSPIIFFVLPYIYLYFFTGLKMSVKTYFELFKVSILGGFNIFSGSGSNNITKYFSVILSIIIYFQNFMNTVKTAKNNNKIINVLHSKLNIISKFMTTSQELFDLTKDIFNHEAIDIFDTELNNELFKSDPRTLSNKGKILVTFKNIENNEIHIDKYKNYFNRIGEIDAYISIITLVKEFKDKEYNICYTRYETNVTPSIRLKDLWHPYLAKNNNYDEITSNSIEIGGTNNPNNIILTGPNAGGKSTFIKAVSLSLLFSQTLGISFSKESYITPMTLINTYLNIPDCKNKESLFEAEMHRARNHLNKLKELGEYDFSFIVMDEIFSSTNPEEGISGAYAICNKLAEYKNSISLITTHFSYLTKLGDDIKFKNYKIPIERNETNEINYPYKLICGASDQHIALELLKKKGFDSSIVDEAMSICKSIKKNNILNDLNTHELVSEEPFINDKDEQVEEPDVEEPDVEEPVVEPVVEEPDVEEPDVEEPDVEEPEVEELDVEPVVEEPDVEDVKKNKKKGRKKKNN
jgi:DNA mismatch repair protein MutS